MGSINWQAHNMGVEEDQHCLSNTDSTKFTGLPTMSASRLLGGIQVIHL